MKSKKFLRTITIFTLLLSLVTTPFIANAHEGNIAPPADNTSQIIGDGNTVVFIDVPSNYWAKDQILYFAQQGIINGYTDGTFKPNAGVTREEFCKLLVSTFKQPLETPNTPTFADVPENRWSYPYVEVCRDFLTGYTNPFGGLPSFHPSEYATREDIAVALVRMMGFTNNDANNPNYAAYNFKDGGSISPNLLPYVSIACEKGLISGYPDGTFGPTKGITRAETVVLLNRATKQAVTNINSELEMTASVLYSNDKKTATINIIAEEGTTVTVNGESVKMSSNYSGEYEGNFVYKFEEEGSKDFVVEGKRAGKQKTVNVTAKYEIGAPDLQLDSNSQTVTSKSFRLSGKVKDDNYSVSLTINGQNVNVTNYGTAWAYWSKDVELEEGANTFEIVATNEKGKETRKSVTITYSVGAPDLQLDTNNQTVTSKSFRLSGKVKDDNYSVSLTINGQNVNVTNYGTAWAYWSKDVELEEGTNTFEIIATNENGKKTRKSVTITYSVGAPDLQLDSNSQTVTSKSFRLSGKVKDDNYSVSLTINGQNVNVTNYGTAWAYWSKDVELEEGANTFEIIATNENGKETRKSVTITYSVGAPDLQLDSSSQTVTSKSFRLSGKVKDDNYSVSLTINGQNVNVTNYGTAWAYWSKDVELEEGTNTFEIVATNEKGKQTSRSVSITLNVGDPKIQFINCPENTKKKNITIIGKISGSNEGAKLFIDDEEVYVNYSSEFSKTVELKEGSNTFEFRAVNNFGKEVAVKKTITYTPEAETGTSEVN